MTQQATTPINLQYLKADNITWIKINDGLREILQLERERKRVKVPKIWIMTDALNRWTRSSKEKQLNFARCNILSFVKDPLINIITFTVHVNGNNCS